MHVSLRIFWIVISQKCLENPFAEPGDIIEFQAKFPPTKVENLGDSIHSCFIL